jgi:hypothetical protein
LRPFHILCGSPHRSDCVSANAKKDLVMRD